MIPASISARARAAPSPKRYWKIGMNRAPDVAAARSTASARRSHAATESTSGFSQITCTPASRQRMICSSCIDGGVQRSMMSTWFGDAGSATVANRSSSEATPVMPQSASPLARLAPSTSANTVADAPSTANHDNRWLCPMPIPTTPTRNSLIAPTLLPRTAVALDAISVSCVPPAGTHVTEIAFPPTRIGNCRVGASASERPVGSPTVGSPVTIVAPSGAYCRM